MQSFNSRSRMGSDLWFRQLADRTSVSIHAPAWGATYFHCLHYSRLWFQFTLPHGERPPEGDPRKDDTMFQFTLPHGERPLVVGPQIDADVSIHAPAWGAT